jgi:tol-pal system protein YbgF
MFFKNAVEVKKICFIVIWLGLFFSLFQSPVKTQIVSSQIDYPTNFYFIAQKDYNSELLKLAGRSITSLVENHENFPAYEKSLLLESQTEFYSGRAEYAKKLLEDYVKKNPSSLFAPFFYENLGNFSFELKQYDKASKYYNLAIESSKKEFFFRKDTAYFELSARCLYRDGVAKLLSGKVDASKEPLETCYRSYSKTSSADDALYFLGLIAEMKGEEESAIGYYKTLQRQYPYSNLLLASKIREASNYIVLRQDSQALLALDNAENTFRRIRNRDSLGLLFAPQDYCEDIEERIKFLRAEALMVAARYEDAIATYNQFLEEFPTSIYQLDAKLKIGLALLEKGDFLRSIEQFDKIINECKDENRLQRQLAELYRAMANRRLGRLSEAQNAFSELAVRSNYQFTSIVLLELGLVYYEKKEFDKANKTFERGLRESTDNLVTAKLNLMLGATNLELKQNQRAIQYYKSAEELARRATTVQMPNKNWFIAESRLKQAIAQILSFRNAEAIQNLLYVLGNFPNDPRSEDALFWLAEAYYRSDMLQNAIDKYEALLAKFPNSKYREESLYGLGWSYFRLKNFKKSSEVFAKLVSEFPSSKYNVEVWLRQGDGYYVLKDFANAITSYRKVVNLAPNSEEAQYASYQICHSLYKMGKLNEAYNEGLEFIKRYPNSSLAPNALYLTAWVKFQQKEYSEAINSFNFLIDAYPNSLLVPRARYAIADALYNLNKFEEAGKIYQEILDKYPTSPLVADALRSLQYCYIAMGREQDAIQIADDYINRNPESPFAMDFILKKGEMFYSGKKFKDAIAEYQNFIQKFPESEKKPEALFWMAKSYESLGEYDNAISLFNQICEKYSTSEYAPQSLLELGLINKLNANLQSADSLFTKLQELYPNDPAAAQAGFEQASIKFTLGDTANAIRIWKRIAQNFEGTEFGDQSLYKIAMYYRISGFYDDAIREFSRLVNSSIDPNLSAEAQYRLGEIYLRLGNRQKAIEEFTKVRDNYAGIEDWFTLSLLNLGELYEQAGSIDEAVSCYRAILATRESDDYTKTAKRRLQILEQKSK